MPRSLPVDLVAQSLSLGLCFCGSLSLPSFYPRGREGIPGCKSQKKETLVTLFPRSAAACSLCPWHSDSN